LQDQERPCHGTAVARRGGQSQAPPCLP
jgi:hypothetical protein